MADIALVWDNVNGRADFAIVNGDLLMDDGLQTAVIISLFCDRQAGPGDVIPDGSADPRGWWGDAAATAGQSLSLTGSKLWLYARSLQTNDMLLNLQAAASEALAWMTAGSPPIASSVLPVASYPSRGRVRLVITIQQGQTANVFDFAWSCS